MFQLIVNSQTLKLRLWLDSPLLLLTRQIHFNYHNHLQSPQYLPTALPQFSCEMGVQNSWDQPIFIPPAGMTIFSFFRVHFQLQSCLDTMKGPATDYALKSQLVASSQAPTLGQMATSLASSPCVDRPAHLEGCSDSRDTIVVTVESRRPSRSSSALPSFQRAQSRSKYFAPLQGTSRSSSSSPAGLFELLRELSTRDRFECEPSAPSLESPRCFGSTLPPPSSSQLLASSPFHSISSSCLIPFCSGHSPPFVSTTEAISVMLFYIPPLYVSIPSSLPYTLASSATPIVSISTCVSISLFSSPPLCLPSLSRFPHVLAFLPRPVLSPTHLEVEISIPIHLRLGDHGTIVANNPRSLGAVSRSGSSTP